jgi:hypothetical protein
MVREATVPVLVYRSYDRKHTDAEPRPVILDTGTGEAADAVEFAFEEASVRGASLSTSATPEAVATWSAKYPEVVVHHTGDPAAEAVPALLAASHDAQLVVLARTPELAAAVDALLARAGCPVAVVG